MLYEWLVPWFNPRPSLGDGDPYRLLERMPYAPGRDLADARRVENRGGIDPILILSPSLQHP
jgi:hypothetical protein